MDLLSTMNQAGNRRMVLLAPSLAGVRDRLERVEHSPGRHERMLAEMQRFRGSVYLGDGAIKPAQLTADGRHRLAIDERSWHVLTLDNEDRVTGCSRYLMHPYDIRYSQLEVVKSAIARCSQMGTAVRRAIEAEMQLAQRSGLAYVEVGGWALSPALRCTTEALKVALATYSLASILGGCIGISTVTVRNHSSSILRRIGGGSLRAGTEELPRYFDPAYGCEMELLRFDSRLPNQRFERWIENIRQALSGVPVLCAAPAPRRTCVVKSTPWRIRPGVLAASAFVSALRTPALRAEAS